MTRLCFHFCPFIALRPPFPARRFPRGGQRAASRRRRCWVSSYPLIPRESACHKVVLHTIPDKFKAHRLKRYAIESKNSQLETIRDRARYKPTARLVFPVDSYGKRRSFSHLVRLTNYRHGKECFFNPFRHMRNRRKRLIDLKTDI